MAIPSQTIEQIAAANDIVDVIGAYFPLKRAGANFKALCPFHQEKTPSFHVSPQRQTFHCFGCGLGGSVFRFVMEYEHIDFPSAVRKLAARAGIPVVEEGGAGADRGHEARARLLRLHSEAAEWFHENLLKKEFGQSAREYLNQRGIDQRVARNWQLGYAPDTWDSLLKWATARGYSRNELLQSGLVKPGDEQRPSGNVYDRFRNRVVFPICNDAGQVIAFSGRVLRSDAEAAKYVNSPETPVFRKGKVLFGLDKTKRSLIETDSAIVCEGQLDLISLFEAGITNVVAPQGTAFTADQARLLKRFVNHVVLCFDADTAGQKAAERSLNALLQNDLIVRVIEMPRGLDPDLLVRRDGKEAFEKRAAMARDFFEYWIDRVTAGADLNSLGEKMRVAHSLADTVSHVRDRFMRGEIINKVSARLGVRASDFDGLVVKQTREARITGTAESGADRVRAGATPVQHEVAMLCLLALRDEMARRFLLDQNWREVLEQTPRAELLVRILGHDLHPEDPASLNAFMATLSPEDEATVSEWLMQRVPSKPLAVAQSWWIGLRQAALRRKLEATESKMRQSQLSTGEVVNLQKEIVDLREQLHEISKLSPTAEFGT